MVVDVKKDTYEYWKAGDPILAIRTKLALSGNGRSETTIRKWINRWSQPGKWSKCHQR
jgi:hypothetical protein